MITALVTLAPPCGSRPPQPVLEAWTGSADVVSWVQSAGGSQVLCHREPHSEQQSLLSAPVHSLKKTHGSFGTKNTPRGADPGRAGAEGRDKELQQQNRCRCTWTSTNLSKNF